MQEKLKKSKQLHISMDTFYLHSQINSIYIILVYYIKLPIQINALMILE